MIDREKVIAHLDDLRQFADVDVHPVVSPENWDIYSTLCDYIDQIKEEVETLLKEQEPRVLTLEEIKKLQSLRDGAIWLETFEDNVVYPALPEISLQNVTYLVAIPFRDYRDWLNNEYYGKTWRCWTSHPTKEQREATPWEV